VPPDGRRVCLRSLPALEKLPISVEQRARVVVNEARERL